MLAITIGFFIKLVYYTSLVAVLCWAFKYGLDVFRGGIEIYKENKENTKNT